MTKIGLRLKYIFVIVTKTRLKLKKGDKINTGHHVDNKHAV